MKLTTRTRYAVRALAYLGAQKRKAVNLNEIAKNERIKPKFLEQIFLKLTNAGILKTIKGPGGGYSLAKNPKRITFKEIMDAVGESYFLINCLKNPKSCLRSRYCPVRPHWLELNKSTIKFFENHNLTSICKKSISKYWNLKNSNT